MLDGFDTFGLNSAYRAYERMDWWPKYHGCYDYRVTENHRDSFNNLINNTPIEKCFYIVDINDDKEKFQYINMQPFGTTNKWNASPLITFPAAQSSIYLHGTFLHIAQRMLISRLLIVAQSQR
jgi:hypothetical protein